MSNNKSLISPIPPEGYGDRFVKFISGLTMTKEEQEREAESRDQHDGSIDTTRHSRKSTDNKVVQRAEKQAHKTEMEGASEEPQHDRTRSAMRSSSAERSQGVQGSTLPVVQEAGEAGSREDIPLAEKADEKRPENAHPMHERQLPKHYQDGDEQLLSLPEFNRLSMGLGMSKSTVAGADN